jgi:hypothetical protein
MDEGTVTESVPLRRVRMSRECQDAADEAGEFTADERAAGRPGALVRARITIAGAARHLVMLTSYSRSPAVRVVTSVRIGNQSRAVFPERRARVSTLAPAFRRRLTYDASRLRLVPCAGDSRY